MDELTKSHKSESKSPSKFYDMRKLRMFTMISLCCTKNFSVTYMIIGLFCYAYGLCDKGFENLNAFGCSVDHIGCPSDIDLVKDQ